MSGNAPSFPRRATLLGAATLAALPASVPLGAQTLAVPPQRGGNPPRFHRIKVGDVEVTTLLDGGMGGTNEGIRSFFPDATPAEIAPLRDRAFALPQGLHQPVGAYVLNTGRNLAMIDCGGHSSFIPTTGGALDALRASGYTPDQVDTVILTHIHPEHALGLSYDGTTRNFPNAEVVLTQIDHQFWTDPAMEGRVPQGQRFIEAARRAIRPYDGRIRTTEMREGLEVIPGVFMDPAPGHTPGHVSYRVTSQNESILIWGDIAHQMLIQLARPRWRVGVDVDSAMGVQARLRTLDMVSTERLLIGGVHVPWSGFGRVVKDGEGYLFAPRPAQFS
jgi:glyoxylase-like metal-dependent hydrolase (beta-lactamase superfamily II)